MANRNGRRTFCLWPFLWYSPLSWLLHYSDREDDIIHTDHWLHYYSGTQPLHPDLEDGELEDGELEDEEGGEPASTPAVAKEPSREGSTYS